LKQGKKNQLFSPPLLLFYPQGGFNGEPNVPDNPIIPFIRGDGTGIDIWTAAQKV
jgi:hypothetical protein